MGQQANVKKKGAMDSVLADLDVDMDDVPEGPDIAPRGVRKQEKLKKDKDGKKSKKGDKSEEKKKRRHSDIDGGAEGKKRKKSKKE